MKKILLATVAVVALGATVPALAADLGAAPRYTKAPAYVAPIYNWTGFYIGGHLGGGFAGDNSILDSSRFLGGIQGGADYQFAPNWVAGIEAQYSWASNNNGSLLFPGGTARELQQRPARIGHRPSRLRLRPGAAVRQGRLCLEGWRSSRRDTAGGVPIAFTTSGNHRDGYTVGTGLEYMFAPNWSAKLEYMYYNFGSTTFVTPVRLAGAGFNDDEHVVKAGVNYRFNWGGPVAGRY